MRAPGWALAGVALVVAAAAGAARAEPPPAASPADAGPPDPASLPFGPGSVTAVVQAHQADVTACYETRLAEGKDVRGQVVVSFVIAADGLPSKARVKKSTLGDKDVEECVLRAVRGWIFPRPARPQPVDLPLQFEELGRPAPPSAAQRPRGG